MKLKVKQMMQCCNASNLLPIGRRTFFPHYRMQDLGDEDGKRYEG